MEDFKERMQKMQAEIERLERQIKLDYLTPEQTEQTKLTIESMREQMKAEQERFREDVMFFKGAQERAQEAFKTRDTYTMSPEMQETKEILNTQINEEEAMNNHYDRIAKMKIEIGKAKKVMSRIGVPSSSKDRHEYTQAESKVTKLENELSKLERLTRDKIIMDAKMKRHAFDKAKKRYEGLSTMQKLQAKISNNKLDWNQIKNDPSITTEYLDSLYVGGGMKR